MSKMISLIFCAIVIGLCHGERTKDKMYKSIDIAAPCFRRLNATHQTGCSSIRGGSTGVVHFIEEKSDLHFILENGTSPPYIPVMPTTLLTLDVMLLIKTSDKISGMALYKANDTPTYYSHEDTCPNRYSSLGNTCSNKVNNGIWNPHGTGFLNEDFPFPIFYINNDEDVIKLKDCFRKFNDFFYENQYVRSLCSLELSAFMHAATDTPTCMRRTNGFNLNFNPMKFCDPLGDDNIWASLFPVANTSTIKLNNKMKYIIITAKLDSTSLFLDITPGASNPVTGMVALLTTAQLLKKMLPIYDNQKKYDQNVLFFLLNGETYDYIGSQRLLYDMEKDVFPEPLNKSAEYPIPQIHPENISLFVEFGQLGNTAGVHMFTYQDKIETTEFITKLKKNTKTQLLKESVGIIPPASLQTFLKSKPNISGLVLTDHGKEFANHFYNSIYDNHTNINYQYYNQSEDIPADSVQYFIANVSNMVARSVFEQITSQEYKGDEEASVEMVNELFHCYLENANCNVHKAIQKKKLKEEPYSLYVSVTANRNPITVLTGLTLAWLTGDVVNPDGPCAKGMKSHVYQYFNMSKSLDELNKTICYQTTMNFSEAMSPAFLIEDYDWKSGQYSSWSESAWKEISARIFLKPSAAHEHMTIAIGSLTLVFSLILVYFVKTRSHILFAPPANISPTSC